MLFFALTRAPFLPGMDPITLSPQTSMKLDLDFRAYGLNDQRIYWSGLEFSFGVEANVDVSITRRYRRGSLTVEAELFLNQPFGKNILQDEFRRDYQANFQVEPLHLSRLNLRFASGQFSVAIGKGVTPFGRFHFSSPSNDLDFAAPFIRSEAILWRETGIFLHWANRFLEVDVAAVNGGDERDTNSGKAGIFRVGLHGKAWAVGASHKIHDGTGSEWQKQYNGHTGLDFNWQAGCFRFSAEWIWDRYGFHRPFDLNEMFWPRSLYYRDIFLAVKTPVKGRGWYGDIRYRKGSLSIALNYGEYYPQKIGNPLHDLLIRRIILRLAVLPAPSCVFILPDCWKTTASVNPGARAPNPLRFWPEWSFLCSLFFIFSRKRD